MASTSTTMPGLPSALLEYLTLTTRTAATVAFVDPLSNHAPAAFTSIAAADLLGHRELWQAFTREDLEELEELLRRNNGNNAEREWDWEARFLSSQNDGGPQTTARWKLVQGDGYSLLTAVPQKIDYFVRDPRGDADEFVNEIVDLLEHTKVGLARTDATGHHLWVNKGWWDITGADRNAPPDEWASSVHPDDVERVTSVWREGFKTQTPINLRFRWKSGEYALASAVPNHDDKSKVTSWIGNVTNISEEVNEQMALLSLSKETESMLRKEAEESESRRVEAVEQKKQQELLIDVVSHEVPSPSFLCPSPSPTDPSHLIQIRNPISAVLQNTEMTRDSLVHIRNCFLELHRAGQLPSCFPPESTFESLSDDIEAMDSITECAHAQERIANDILGLAQIQLRRYSITPVPFDLLVALRNTCRMFKSECKVKGIDLQLVLGSSLERLGPRARVHADPTRLAQILINLLSNAIRFTAKSLIKKVTLSVEVSSIPPARDGDVVPPEETDYHVEESQPIYLFFSVEDTGPGMSEDETRGLFERFQQASPLTHTTMGGSGLGLWIARNLCELQLGRVEVKSVQGQGSIFRCFISARSVDAGGSTSHETRSARTEGITGSLRAASPSSHPPQSPSDAPPKHGKVILCCEDNLINRTVLKKQLVKAGHEVVLACDGKEGLDALAEKRERPIELILMDIEKTDTPPTVPVMGGLEATRAIRAVEKETIVATKIRIVGLTGNARAEQVAIAIEAGMDTVVTKPYRIANLLEVIAGTAEPEPNVV
ncbi:histidine kinase [Pseudohyphozyma bogoriensis]|nr:histidine kinase [Pseudohyphozyma bogoriensis]